MISILLGGVGIFLIGMIIMTNGLKALGGETLRKVLTRFTGGNISAIFSGFAVTSLVQASSATILATIGFVSAGLMSFTQVIAVIYGANLGATVTGWLVSLLGFKLSGGLIAMPMVGVGSLFMLLGKGRNASIGMLIAGFAMLFVGIGILQNGMQNLAAYVDVRAFPRADWTGRLVLIAAGGALTIITQSSSAALVTALSALNTGNISIEQTAAFVIGLSIGKTSTAVIAAIGASVQAKRAALVHILFNMITGTAVYILFTPFVGAIKGACAFAGVDDASIIISTFYSSMIIFGIVLLYPFIGIFQAVIEKAIPERGSTLTRNLDNTVTKIAAVAVETARRTVINIAAVIMKALRELLLAETTYRQIVDRIDDAENALKETTQFLGKVRSQPGSTAVHQRHLAVLHAIDHLERLADACREFEEVRTVARIENLRTVALAKIEELDSVMRWLQGYSPQAPVHVVEAMSRSIAGIRKAQRVEVLELTADGEMAPDTAMRQLEAMRWLDRLAYHIWRAIYHLNENLQEGLQEAGAKKYSEPDL